MASRRLIAGWLSAAESRFLRLTIGGHRPDTRTRATEAAGSLGLLPAGGRPGTLDPS
jgi:hypothetical protein